MKKKRMPRRRRFTEKMCPAIENMRSTAAEKAWTISYFLANKDKPGKTISCVRQKSRASFSR